MALERVTRTLTDAVMPLSARPGRTLSGIAGAAIAVALIILANAYATDSRGALADDLKVLDSSRISVTSRRKATVASTFSTATVERVQRLPGVIAAGLAVDLGQVRAQTRRGEPGVLAARYGVSVGAFEAMEARGVPAGSRTLNRHQVVYVGAGLARGTGLARLEARPSVLIGQLRYAVIGVIDQAAGLPTLLNGLAVNLCCGRSKLPARKAELIVRTHPDATQQLADILPQIIDASYPTRVTIAVDSSPTMLREGIESTASESATVISLAALIFGMIVNAMLRYASVRERRREFGLRSALGARGSDIVLQVVCESLLIGLAGACVGVVVGGTAAVLLADASGNPLGVTPAFCVAAGLLGIISGGVAGVGPALAASRIDPAVALRS